MRLSNECAQANGTGNYLYNSNELWLLNLSINEKNTNKRFIKIIIVIVIFGAANTDVDNKSNFYKYM